MTREKFLSLLNECQYTDNPILEHQDFDYRIPNSRYVRIVLKAERIEPALIHRVDRINNGHHRLTKTWVQYNRWLNKWYIDNAPIGHLSSITELKALWRASGNSDEEVEKLLIAEGHIKMADGNVKSKAMKLVAKIITQMEEHAEECDLSLENNVVSDERVESLMATLDSALNEAHALGVVAGRDEGL